MTGTNLYGALGIYLIACIGWTSLMSPAIVFRARHEPPKIKYSGRINAPADIALSPSGVLYVLEVRGQRIAAFDLNNGRFQTLVSATDPGLQNPRAIAVDSRSNLYLTTGDRTLVVVTEVLGTAGLVTRTLAHDIRATALATTDDGDVLIADSFGNQILRWVSGTGQIEIIAGGGIVGFSGDGGPARNASLRFPTGVAATPSGDILISDSGNCRIRRIDHRTSSIVTVAGTGRCESVGDGGKAVSAGLDYPDRIATDSTGNIYVVEGASNRIRRIDPSGIIRAVAGTGTRKSTGDGGPSWKAGLANPSAVAIDSDGNIYIAEYAGNRIRRIDSSSGKITTFLGNGLPHRADPIL